MRRVSLERERRDERAKGERVYLAKGERRREGGRSRKTVCVLFEGERILYKG